jgi:HEAT repeat protein
MRLLLQPLLIALSVLPVTVAVTAQQPEPAHEGCTVSEWLARLKDPDKKVRHDAALSLNMMGPEAAKIALPVVLDQLKNKDAIGRPDAAFLLRQFVLLDYIGPEVKTVLPAVIGYLKDSDVEVRQEAAFALGYFGAAGKPAIPALIDGLKDSDMHVRSWCIHALSSFGADARPAVPALTHLLKDPERYLRVTAAEALWRLGEKKQESLTVLIAAVKEGNWDERAGAARVLGDIGPDARAALPALLKASEQPFPLSMRCGDLVDRQFVILDAIGKIDPKAANKAEEPKKP